MLQQQNILNWPLPDVYLEQQKNYHSHMKSKMHITSLQRELLQLAFLSKSVIWLIPRSTGPWVISNNQISVTNRVSLFHLSEQNHSNKCSSILYKQHIYSLIQWISSLSINEKVWPLQNYLPAERKDQDIWLYLHKHTNSGDFGQTWCGHIYNFLRAFLAPELLLLGHLLFSINLNEKL